MRGVLAPEVVVCGEELRGVRERRRVGEERAEGVGVLEDEGDAVVRGGLCVGGVSVRIWVEGGGRTSMGCAASPMSTARELAETKSSGTGRRTKTREATVVASARTLRGLCFWGVSVNTLSR